MSRLLHLTASTVDLASGVIRRGADELRLGALEHRLLTFLVDAAPRVVSRDELTAEVWDGATGLPTRAVDQAVRRLRKKVGDPGRTPRHIVGVYGEGYRFVPLATERPAPREPHRPAGNLLRSPRSFVGRADDLARLREALHTHGGALLRGPAGVGKSRLAREGAWRWREEYPDGTWLLDLDSVGDAAEAIRRLEALLDAPNAASPTLESALQGLGTAPRALLLLDNAEDAPAFAADLVRVARRDLPTLRVVVTSRVPVDAGCPTLEVAGLPPEDAASLLASRALAHVPELPQGGDLTELVELLDGSPLAIELAAIRLRLLTPDEMARRLRQGRRVLGSDPSGALRHSSVDAAICSSWDALNPAEREALQALSAFGGTLSNAAAEHLLGSFVPGEEPLSLLDALLDGSLIQLSGTRPHRLLVYRSVREFIEGRDSASNPKRRRAVARSLGAWGGRIVHELMGPEQERVARTLALDLPFIEHASVWMLEQHPDSAMQLLHAIVEYSWLTGLTSSAERLTALAMTRPIRDPLAARDVRLIRAVVLVLLLRNTEAQELLLGLDYAPDELWRRSSRAFLLANCQSINGPSAALRTVDDALAALDGNIDRLPLQVAEARLLTLRARLRSLTGEPEAVLAELRRARRAWAAIGSPSGEGAAAVFVGWFESKLRRDREALASLQRATALLEGVGGERHRVLARTILALVRADLGDLDRARDTIGDPPPPGQHADLATALLHSRGLLHLASDDSQAAERDLASLRDRLRDEAHPFYLAYVAALDAWIGVYVDDAPRVLRACARARRYRADGALPTAAGLSGPPLLLLAATCGDVEGGEALLEQLEADFQSASELRAITALLPGRVALAYARARADRARAREHRQAARDLLREGRARPSVHQSPALCALDAQLALRGIERTTDGQGELRKRVSAGFAEEVRAEVRAWLEPG